MRFQSIELSAADRGPYKLLEPRPEAEELNPWNSEDTNDNAAKSNGATDDFDALETVAKEKALVKKIDRRVMPCLFAMIVLNYLDRNGLANARVQGIEKSLGMSGSDFSTAVSIFFVGYVGLQVPSNLLITRVRPSLYLVSELNSAVMTRD
jgi:hypothetical protein